MLQLNKEQEQAVRHRDGPMLVLAGPGSGKTAVLTGRIQYLIEAHGVSPEKILVLTFSKEAAAEMRERFVRLIGEESSCPVHFGTFHAVFYHILKKQGLYNENSILTPNVKREFIYQIGKELKVPDYQSAGWQDTMLSAISKVKSGSEADFPDPKEQELFERIALAYAEKCRREKKLDFDDMITECIRLLREIPKVLLKWQEKYEYILVDEFQDIDKRQYEVLKLLAGNRRNVFAVGDDDQSIYGFRGACPAVLKAFKEDYPELAVVNLTMNYRSCKEIIEEAVRVISHNTDRLPKRQSPFREEPGEVMAVLFKNAAQESLYVADQIEALLRESLEGGGKPELSIGVLYRTEQCAQTLENELKARRLAYVQTKSRRFYYDDENVQDILAYFRLAAGEGGRSELLRILNKPERRLSRDAFIQTEGTPEKDLSSLLARLSSYYSEDEERICYVNQLRENLDFLSRLPAKAAFNFVLKGIGYERVLYGKGGKEVSELPAESEVVSEFVAELSGRMENTPYLKEFLTKVRLERELYEKEREREAGRRTGGGAGERLVLQTVHASKGLEYDVVFIIGLQEGVFPHKKAEGKAGLEEERRLFYVAMTRARDRLYLCARRRETFGKRESAFIHEVSCPIRDGNQTK